jgi:enamine deaminase RidA (YjgF/YER057c/UK114 family)
LVGDGDFDAQVRQVFENLTGALGAADASWTDVVKLNY